jgi:DNA replication protein DnaC
MSFLEEYMAKLNDPVEGPKMRQRAKEAEERRAREEEIERRMEESIRVGRAFSRGFPEDKIDIVNGGRYEPKQLHTDVANEWLSKVGEWRVPWLFVSANSGAGKSTLLTYCGIQLLKAGKKVQYYRFSDLLDSVRKPETDLSGLDGLVVDDWWRYQWIGRQETQDQALSIIDYCYRRGLTMVIGSDKPIASLKEQTNESVSPQIFGRLRERCGKYVIAMDGVDLRLS